jgi:Asp-tRNA(Asn)/Glu-tRNA(Gln) amidotransferase A subunit family amidase
LTEVLFDDALKEAERLDRYYQQHGTLVGPLHGVPITLKDQFDVKGVDTTIGYVARSFKPATNDAAIVQILKSLGAIILTKTNLPQSIMVSMPTLSGERLGTATHRSYSGAKRRLRFGV